MAKVFHVYLEKADQPESGAYAELFLPATPYQIQDAFDKLRLEPGKQPYLDILDCREAYDYLERCIQKQPDIFQLNALAKKLSELLATASMASFEGLVGIEMKKGALPVPLPRLIDFAYSVDCCHIIGDAVTDYALGRFLVENEFVPEAERLSEAAFKLLDFEKIGREHRETMGGIYTGFGYVEQHAPPAEVYQILDLTPKTPDYTILLKVSKGFFNDPGYDSDKTVQLKLPASLEELSSALEAVGAWDWREAGLSCLDCRIPALTEVISDAEAGIDFLNDLAQRLAGLEPKTLTAYKALLEATDCKDLQSAEALIDSLDNYIFSPQYSSPAEVAKGELSVVLCDEDAETLTPYLNMYQYGQALIKKCGGTLTAYGLIEREDHHLVLSEKNMPNQGGMEMKY